MPPENRNDWPLAIRHLHSHKVWWSNPLRLWSACYLISGVTDCEACSAAIAPYGHITGLKPGPDPERYAIELARTNTKDCSACRPLADRSKIQSIRLLDMKPLKCSQCYVLTKLISRFLILHFESSSNLIETAAYRTWNSPNALCVLTSQWSPRLPFQLSFSIGPVALPQQGISSASAWPIFDLDIRTVHHGGATGGQSILGNDLGAGDYNPLSIDARLRRASLWLHECLERHPACDSSYSTAFPKRLLDVRDRSKDIIPLVECENLAPLPAFACLSYCWGVDDPSMTTDTNYQDRIAGSRLDSLPRTIQDAIYVCRALNIEFIWIDALCIIQGNAADWADQCMVMGEIYAGSQLTIVAASAASCDQGFLQVLDDDRTDPPLSRQTKTERRCHANVEIEVQQEDHTPTRFLVTPSHTVAVLRKMHKGPKPSIRERAWTLQEYLLAPRILEFGSEHIGWHCHATYENEINFFKHNDEQAQQGNLKYQFEHDFRSLIQGQKGQVLAPGATWRNLVSEYSSRKLTNERDRLVALAGLVSRCQRFSSNIYRAGLWTKTDLFWYHDWGQSEWGQDFDSYPSRPLKERAPTWSWASVLVVKSVVRYMEYTLPEYESQYSFRERAELIDWQCDTGGLGDAAISPTGHIVLNTVIISAVLEVVWTYNGDGDSSFAELVKSFASEWAVSEDIPELQQGSSGSYDDTTSSKEDDEPRKQWKLETFCSWGGRSAGQPEDIRLDCPRSAPIGPPDASMMSSSGRIERSIDVKLVSIGTLHSDGMDRACFMLCWKRNDAEKYERIGLYHPSYSRGKWRTYEKQVANICIV